MKYNINRKDYKRVKKMDRIEMDRFVNVVYQEGIKLGVEQGRQLKDALEYANLKSDILEIVDKSLKITKGVGPKTYDNIMMSLQEVIKDGNK